MYSVSNDFRNSIKKQVIRSKLKVNIDGTDYSDDYILQGSFSITNQCSDSSDVTLGAVYVGQLSCTFLKSIPINRNTWKSRIIKPYYSLKLEDGSYEEIPLGVFVVDEATYSMSGVEVKAYDFMPNFDKKLVIQQTMGNPYDFLLMICTNCNVELGMTEEEVEALPNGSTILDFYSRKNDVESYRDMLFRLAQILGGFATIDRQGKLVIRTYVQTIIDDVDTNRRFNTSKFSDYTTNYTGLSYASIEDGQTHYFSQQEDTGLTINLGTNPFLQTGTKTYIQMVCQNILNAISNIRYTPFEVSVLGNPAYDLGDVIECVDGLAGTSSVCCIMKYTFSYHSDFSIEGFGKDPALANAKSKVDKNISGLIDRISENEIIFTTFTNAESIELHNEESTIIDIRFASAKASYAVFQAEILVDASTEVIGLTYNDITAEVTYILNRSEIETYHPTQILTDGKHIINLTYVIPVENAMLNRWQVKLNVSDGTLNIDAENIKATIYGQGIVATEEWDGYLDFEEDLNPVAIRSIGVSTFSDAMACAPQIPHMCALTEHISDVPIRSTLISGFTEHISFDIINVYVNKTALIDVDNPPSYDARYVEYANDAYRLIDGQYAPQYLIKKMIDSYSFVGINEVGVNASNVTLQFSNDGSTWMSYQNDIWTETSTEMSVNTVTALTNAQWLQLVDDGVLWVKVSLYVANSALTELSIEYKEDVEE